MPDPAITGTATEGTQPAAAAPPPEKPTTMIERRAARRAEYLAKPLPRPAEAKPEEKPSLAAAPAESKVEPKAIDAKPPEPKLDDKDPTAERGLVALERQRKKFLDEQAVWKSEVAIREAKIAQLENQTQGKVTSIDELKKLKPIDVLDRLGISEDDYALIARQSYARTAAGRNDPKALEEAKRYEADRVAHTASSELEQVKAELATLRNEVTETWKQRDLAEATRQNSLRWLDDAVKVLSADKPTLFGRHHAKAPEAAKQKLLDVAIELQKANDGIPPAHGEVIAEYDKRRRADLEELGVDVDALLKPAAVKADKTAEHKASEKPTEQKPPARTIGMGGTGFTRPPSRVQARAEKREAWLKRPTA